MTDGGSTVLVTCSSAARGDGGDDRRAAVVRRGRDRRRPAPRAERMSDVLERACLVHRRDDRQQRLWRRIPAAEARAGRPVAGRQRPDSRGRVVRADARGRGHEREPGGQEIVHDDGTRRIRTVVPHRDPECHLIADEDRTAGSHPSPRRCRRRVRTGRRRRCCSRGSDRAGRGRGRPWCCGSTLGLVTSTTRSVCPRRRPGALRCPRRG